MNLKTQRMCVSTNSDPSGWNSLSWKFLSVRNCTKSEIQRFCRPTTSNRSAITRIGEDRRKEKIIQKRVNKMENSTWCSLDGPGCNIWKNTSNLVQNRSWLTETSLINTTCNGSMVNGDCIVRYSMILELCCKSLLENILEEKKWRIWLCVTLKFRNYLIEFCLLRQKRWTLLQCPHGARWTFFKTVSNWTSPKIGQ